MKPAKNLVEPGGKSVEHRCKRVWAASGTTETDESDSSSSDLYEDDADEEEDEDEDDDDDDDDETASDEEKQFQAEFKAHKRHYYMDKLEFSEVDG